jgi:methyl-accepting chemotaxis protein
MLAKLKISARLGIAVLLPILIIIALAGYNIALKWETRSEMAQLGPLADGVAKLSRFVHELQRERGASAVFIGSKGAQMRAELPGQRKRTDEQRQIAAASMTALGATATGEFKDALRKAETAVSSLDGRRREIDGMTITAPASSAYFTETIASLLTVTNEIAKVAGQGNVSMAVSAYVSFLQGKERAGQERAFAAGGVSAGRFELANYARVLGLVAAQDVYFNTFQAMATPGQREVFTRTMAGNVTDTVLKMRETILAGGLSGDLKGLDGKSWFDGTTARIDLLKTVEDRVAADLTALTERTYNDATRALIVLVSVLVAAFLVSLSLVFVMARSITRPIGDLCVAMNDLAAGNTARDVPGLNRRDEIGEMAAAVGVFKDNMLEAERLRAEQSGNEQRAAAQRKADMHKLADEFQAAVGAIVDTVSSASTELEAAAGTLTRTAEVTQELSGTVAAASEQASANVQSVASSTEEMTSSVNEISRQVQESSKIAGEAVRQAQQTDVRINQLSQAAGRIGDVVKLITAIAEQTNLLALNATIEAARAGEAGRGFAVVASEVKQLASQTAKATDEISTQIAGMQTATQDSVAAIKEIGGTIGRISEIASTIAAAVEEQGAATQEIARNVGEAAKGTQQVAANITDVNRGAGETGSASAQVLSSAQSLSGESNHLKAEVEKFLMTVRAA